MSLRGFGVAVVVMQAAEDGCGHDGGAGWKRAALRLRSRKRQILLRGCWAECAMRPLAVVVVAPFDNDAAEVVLAEWDDPVEVLAEERTDEAFAEGVRLRTSGR